MRKILSAFMMLIIVSLSAQVGIGTTTPRGALEINGSNGSAGGLVLPSAPNAEAVLNPVDALSTQVPGTVYFDQTESCMKMYDGAAWDCLQGTNNSSGGTIAGGDLSSTASVSVGGFLGQLTPTTDGGATYEAKTSFDNYEVRYAYVSGNTNSTDIQIKYVGPDPTHTFFYFSAVLYGDADYNDAGMVTLTKDVWVNLGDPDVFANGLEKRQYVIMPTASNDNKFYRLEFYLGYTDVNNVLNDHKAAIFVERMTNAQ